MPRAPSALFGLAMLVTAVPASAEWVPAEPSPEGSLPHFAVVEADEASTTMDFSLPGLWLTRTTREGETLAELELPEGGSLRDLGRPALATAARLLAVPPDAEPWVEVLEADVVWVDAPPPVPAAPHPTRQGDPTAWWVDRELYASDVTWPQDSAAIEGPAMMRKLAVARLEVRAARYDFGSGQLGLLRSARIRVHHEGQSDVLHPADIDSAAFADLYGYQVFNYTLPDDGVAPVPETMLVIVEDDLVEALQPLVDWKIKRGMQVTVRTLDEVGSATEDVQAAIDEAYETWDPPVTHILLVGDNVPYYRGTYDNCASDYMFTTLEGNDLLPDVLISRVVAASADDVSVQVNKFLTYERTPPTGEAAEWMRQATGAATNESGMSVTDEQRFDRIAVSLEDAGYDVIDRFYVTDGSATADNILTAINEGRGWLVYLGHGSGYDFSSTSPTFGMSHVAQLTNTHAWPFLTDCSCLNGGFDGPGDVLDEAFMKQGTPDAPAGAVGVFGSSTSTSWDPAGDLAEGVTYGFLDNGHAIWGASALWAESYVFEQWGSGMDSEWLFQQWVLFGDSSLMMRSQPPIAAEVTYPTGFALGDTEFTVTVAVEGEPFTGATVALHKGSEVDEVAITDETGTAVFDLSCEEKGAMDVVVTGRDLAPHEGQSDAGSPPGGFGSGCAAARSPFAYNPAGAGFGAAVGTSAYPGGSALALGGLGLIALLRRIRRRQA